MFVAVVIVVSRFPRLHFILLNKLNVVQKVQAKCIAKRCKLNVVQKVQAKAASTQAVKDEHGHDHP